MYHGFSCVGLGFVLVVWVCCLVALSGWFGYLSVGSLGVWVWWLTMGLWVGFSGSLGDCLCWWFSCGGWYNTNSVGYCVDFGGLVFLLVGLIVVFAI